MVVPRVVVHAPLQPVLVDTLLIHHTRWCTNVRRMQQQRNKKKKTSFQNRSIKNQVKQCQNQQQTNIPPRDQRKHHKIALARLHWQDCIGKSAMARVHWQECNDKSATTRVQRQECIGKSAMTKGALTKGALPEPHAIGPK